ncbi:MAG TPA: GntR family transcriptional regulator [Telluria sp.]|nr:GntR family transcriptional regulator [Telluria sp.]
MSASERIQEALRDRILGGELLPGSRLDEHGLAAEFEVSRTPVHEAVRQLAQDGLVEVRPRAGTYVARFSAAALEEALFVLRALAVALAERAAERASAEDLAALHGALEQLARQRAVAADFRAAEQVFLHLLARIAGVPGVAEQAARSKALLDRYRQLTLEAQAWMDEALTGLGEVVRAIESRHTTKAVLAMHRHLDQALPLLAMARRLRPEFFAA